MSFTFITKYNLAQIVQTSVPCYSKTGVLLGTTIITGTIKEIGILAAGTFYIVHSATLGTYTVAESAIVSQ